MTNVALFGIFGSRSRRRRQPWRLQRAACNRGRKPPASSFDGKQFSVERHVGLIGDTFTNALGGGTACRRPRHRPHTTLFHHRRRRAWRNVQPFLRRDSPGGGFAIAHNGNITNALTVQRELQEAVARSSPPPLTPRTILHLIATARRPGFVPKFIDGGCRGSRSPFRWSAFRKRKLIGARRSLGHPAAVHRRISTGGLYPCVGTCALDIIGARFVRDVQAGEVVVSPARA